MRTLAPRLSIAAEYRPCSFHDPPDGTIPLTRCGPDPADAPADRVLELAARAAARVRAEADPDALHTVALIDLLWADSAGTSLARSISYLETASRLTERPAPVLADLAAAYLVRAERTQSPRDLLEAIEAAQHAVALEPAAEAARFNLALALDRLGLDTQAVREWQVMMERDSLSGWATEARRHRDALVVTRSLPTEPTPGASGAAVAAYVAAAPQEALQFGWDRALGEWAAAVLANDTTRAAGWLRLAAEMGEALKRRGGDASLADAERVIRSHAGEPRARRALARAHREYSDGRTAYLAGDYTGAMPRLAAARVGAAASRPLRDWATVFHAVTLAYSGRSEPAERALTEVAARADTLRHPAVAGRALAARGSIRHRGGRQEAALADARRAAPLLTRAGEHENAGAVELLTTDAEFTLGDAAAAHRSLHRALRMLRVHRGSAWLHGLLYVAAEETMAAHLVRAAVRIQDEGVEVAERTGKPAYVAEALLARARLRAAASDTLGALQDVRDGQAAVARLDPGYMQDWMEAELRLTRVALTSVPGAGDSAAALDSVVAFFEATGVPLRLLPALLTRADTRLALGQTAHAEADLERVVALLEERRDATTRASLRAALTDARRGAFDRMVMLHANAGRPTEALAYLERGRGGPSGRLAAPPGQVAVDYAVIGDTVLIWTVTDTTVHLTRTTVARAELLRTLERAHAALELHAEAAARPALAALYDWLIRPIAPRLGAPETPLVLIADGEIAGVPFAALLDRHDGHYLVERHPVRFASHLRATAGRREPREPGPPEPALLVADPAFDAREHPGLARLSGAYLEVEAVAAGYAAHTLLAGAAAHRQALREALPTSSVVHFAGHAVFDDERPERSYLVLAPEEGRVGSGRLTAAGLEAMDLRRVRLVVLSACRTLSARATRSGGFAGFADALLAAGAGGVVGSLWRVDDGLTRPLMTGFHRAYAASGDGAAALRSAQLALLRSPDPALRSPAAWAGFRYAGH